MHAVRDHLALRLGTGDPDDAVRLAKRLSPWFGVGKVGIDLISAGGPGVVERLQDAGLSIFCDFKLHDIPDQVRASARAVARLGARYVTMHAAGGIEMLRDGLRGLEEGSREVGLDTTMALAVTVLTSDPDTSAFDARFETALAAGCRGVVCSAHEASIVKEHHADLVVVTPAIRLAGGDDHDQSRTATPGAAIAAGADVLVVGRPVTAAADPEATAERVAAEVEDALATRLQ
jgi:orotidine-5'-phosphate decarboxylase